MFHYYLLGGDNRTAPNGLYAWLCPLPQISGLNLLTELVRKMCQQQIDQVAFEFTVHVRVNTTVCFHYRVMLVAR